MKFSGYCLLFFCLLSQPTLNAQEEKNTNEFILTGYCTANDLSRLQVTAEWYVPGYAAYSPDQAIIDELKPHSDRQITFTVIMGIWCSDSREHIPHFFKVIDVAGFSREEVTMIGVDRKKMSEGIDVSYFKFEKIPTFIVLEDEIEIGRIIETPAESVEADLLKILNSKNR